MWRITVASRGEITVHEKYTSAGMHRNGCRALAPEKGDVAYSSERAPMNLYEYSNTSQVRNPAKATLVRQLGLAKLRELRRAGMSFLEIGRRYSAPRASWQAGESGFEHRLPPERLLSAPGGELHGAGGSDAAAFLRALDALGQPLAFFSRAGEPLHLSRAMRDALEGGQQATRLRGELEHFATWTCSLVRLRDLNGGEVIEGIAVQEVPGGPEPLRLSASFVGVDLFGRGSSVLVALERPPADPLSEAGLRTRFRLTPKEARIARLVALGRSNPDIARALCLSVHTVRHHVEHVLRKLRVKSRQEVAPALLRPEAAAGRTSRALAKQK